MPKRRGRVKDPITAARHSLGMLEGYDKIGVPAAAELYGMSESSVKFGRRLIRSGNFQLMYDVEQGDQAVSTTAKRLSPNRDNAYGIYLIDISVTGDGSLGKIGHGRLAARFNEAQSYYGRPLRLESFWRFAQNTPKSVLISCEKQVLSIHSRPNGGGNEIIENPQVALIHPIMMEAGGEYDGKAGSFDERGYQIV